MHYATTTKSSYDKTVQLFTQFLGKKSIASVPAPLTSLDKVRS